MSSPSPFRYAKDFPVGTICVDLQDPETGLRGLVVRGPFSFCAYVGAPQNHALYSLEELEFSCHFGLTFRGEGSDIPLPSGWYYFGWDYGHFTDAVEMPGMDEWMDSTEEGQALRRMLSHSFFSGQRKKNWSVEEVTEDVLDALCELRDTLRASESHVHALRNAVDRVEQRRLDE